MHRYSMKSAIFAFAIALAVQITGSAQEPSFPLGTYSSVITQDDIIDPGLKAFAAEWEITFLPGGKLRARRNDGYIGDGASPTYIVTQNQIEFSEGAGCVGPGVYQWKLEGNKLTFAPVLDRPDACAVRKLAVTTKPFFKVEPNAALWKQLALEGGTIWDLLAHEGRLFAATSGGGVWVSDDGGASWNPTVGISGYNTYSLAGGNVYLLAGTNFGQIFRSPDNGQNWYFTDTGQLQATVYALAIAGNNAFAGTFGGGVLRSSNGGRSWSPANTGLANLNVYDLAVVGDNLFAATNGGGVFRSSDRGQSWTPVNTGLNRLLVRSLTVDGKRIFAGTAGSATIPGAVFVSEDNGQNWSQFGDALPVGANDSIYTTYDLKVSGTRVFAATINGVLSSDGGTWTRASTGLPTKLFLALAASGNRVLAGSFGLGLIRSDDNGQNWIVSNTGLKASVINTIVASDSFICAGGESGLFVSRDGGQNWATGAIARNNGEKPEVYELLVSGSGIFAGTDDGVYASSNGGQDWTRAGNGLVNLPGVNLSGVFVNTLAASGDRLFAGTFRSGVFVSTDRGQNWAAANTRLTNLEVNGLAVIGANVFAATYGGGVFVSANNGQSWEAVNNGLTDRYVYSLATIGSALFAATESSGVFRSTDNGRSWIAVNNGITRPYVYKIAAVGNNLYTTSLSSDGSFRSTDQGQTWTSINAGLPNRFVSQFSANGGRLYAGGHGGGVAVSDALVNQNTTVSAASFSASAIVEKAIVAAFGQSLANGAAIASSLPLPTTLAGTTVKIRDSNGVERQAPLFFVSPGQINYQIPAGTVTGPATATITNSDGIGATGAIQARETAPAVFTANASGTGAAAVVDALTGAPPPFNATQANGQPNIIAVFGTGLGADATDVDGNVNASVQARIDGNPVTAQYAGRAPGFAGLNQFNLVLPAGITSGAHTLTISRGGVTSNTVTIAIR